MIALISSSEDPNPEIKASDINLIFNYIHSTPSLYQEETWTTMCIPGISEEFLLHVYCKFDNEALGIVYISTSDEDTAFTTFSESATNLFADIKSVGLLNHIQSWGTKCFDPIQMQEITCALIRNNNDNQYVAYNFPAPSNYSNEEYNL